MLEAELTKERPLVSVGLLTYNHEDFIGRAIEGVLKQEVNFTYEIVIAEDCSTDRTREIIKHYKALYPDVIRLLLQEENVGMKENSKQLRRACRGKYRANLEGDDYWFTTDKLQKQVDFLENNKEFVAIGGDFFCVDENDMPTEFPWGDIRYSYCQENEYTVEHLKEWLLFAHTSTMMYRNFFYEFDEETNRRFDEVNMLGDRRVCLLLVMHGRVWHEKTIWSIRHVLKKANTSMTRAVKTANYLGVNYGWMLEAERYCWEEFNYKLDLHHKKDQRWLGSLKLFVKKPNRENYEVVKYIFNNSSRKIFYVFLAIKAGIKKILKVFKRDGLFGGLKNGCIKFGKVIKALKNLKSKKNNVPENSQTKAILKSFSK